MSMRVLALIALAIAATPALGQEAKDRPNIVIILADDLGIGDVGCFNPKSKIATPNIDRLAKQGMRFTDAHSPSAVCSPTRYGLLTGRYPFRSPLKKGVVAPWGAPIIEQGRLTLASMLRRLGYRTACIGKWHLGWNWATRDGKVAASGKDKLSNVDFSKAIANGPTTKGFDYYFGVDLPNFPPYCFIENDRTVGIPDVVSTPEINRPGPMLAGWKQVEILPEVSRRSQKYIAEAAKKKTPFFLYVPLTSPHYPVVPAKTFQNKSGVGNYGDFVMQTDAVVGEIVRALDEHGLTENTIVIFTSDNGPEVVGEVGIGAYERLRRYGHASMGIYRGVKRDLWEGGHRMPFVIRWPGKIAPDSTSDQTIGFTDIMATVAAITKTPLPNDAAEDSIDISAAFRGEKVKREGLIHGSGSGKLALRQGDWVLIASPSGEDNAKKSGEPDWFRKERGYTAHKQPFELFNLRDDPTQKTNRYADEMERARSMQATLEQFQRDGRSVPKREEK
ncbi:MAG TPA: arylsulfatase [Gemmataceae bacterium]|nr:arylsulfatase [Gemmataceae bacterium]